MIGVQWFLCTIRSSKSNSVKSSELVYMNYNDWAAFEEATSVGRELELKLWSGGYSCLRWSTRRRASWRAASPRCCASRACSRAGTTSCAACRYCRRYAHTDTHNTHPHTQTSTHTQAGERRALVGRLPLLLQVPTRTNTTHAHTPWLQRMRLVLYKLFSLYQKSLNSSHHLNCETQLPHAFVLI